MNCIKNVFKTLLLGCTILVVSCKSDKPVTIEFCYQEQVEMEEHLLQLVTIFQEATQGIIIVPRQMSGDQLINSFENGAGTADCYRYQSELLSHPRVRAGLCTFDSVPDNTADKGFNPEALKVTSDQDGLYAIPDNFGRNMLLFYNSKFVKTPPATSKDLFRFAKRLKGNWPGVYPLVYDQNEPAYVQPWITSFDHPLLTSFDTDDISIPASVRAFQFLYDLKYRHNLLPDFSNYSEADTLFKEGRAAMIINGAWSLHDYKTVLGKNLGVAEIPAVSETGTPARPFASTFAWGIDSEIKKSRVDAVMEFITFMTSEPVQRKWLHLGRLPSREGFDEEPLIVQDKVLATQYKMLENAVARPAAMDLKQFYRALRPELEQMMRDRKSPQDLVDTYLENLKPQLGP
jgi:arabinogalactan oligomer/maltooligosaccharide transport system substrate-binding protein